MPNKQSYWDGYNEGNRIYDGSPYDYGAARKQSQLEEQQRKEKEQRDDTIKKSWNELGNSGHSPTSTSYSGTSDGSNSLKWFFILGAIIFVCFWFFRMIASLPSYYLSGYQNSKLDEISDAPAKPGFVNIAEEILIYPNNKKNAVGKFKYGIPEDSIRWFLAKANIDKAPMKRSWSNAKMVYLKNVPRHWVVMTNGKKPVSKGWFLVFMFHNYVHVTEEEYRRIRAANGL